MNQSTGERRTGALRGADGVRALASLMVICGHLVMRLDIDSQRPWLQDLLHFVRNWGFAVSGFFVLSGVLLSLPFWRRYLAGHAAPALGTYTSRRFWRLAPAFWVALLVSFAVACIDGLGPHPWVRLLSGLTFTSAFHYVTFFPSDLNGSLWSLSFEVFCYVMLPVCMAAMFALAARRHPDGRSRRFLPAFGYWGLVLALAMAVHGWALTALDPGAGERGWAYGLIGGAKYWMPHFSVFGMYAHFAVGVLAGGCVAWRERQHEGEGAWHAPTHPIYDIAAACALAGAAAVIWMTRRSPEFDFSIGSQPFAFPTFALLVALAVGALPFSTVLGRLLDNRYARYTSAVSFGLYLWNELVFDLVRRLTDGSVWLNGDSFEIARMHSVGPWLAVSVVAFASVYAVAHLSYAWIERPFLAEAGRWPTLLGDGLRHARRCMAAATASLPFAGATRATSGRGVD